MKRLIILLLIVGCYPREDCAGVEGGEAELDNCGVCEGDGTIASDGYVLLWGECYDIETTTTLYLSSNELTGQIPPEIGNLTNLTTLWLSSNELTGEIPSEIGSLINLTYLNLYNNQLTGEIPDSIGNLTNLTTLNLGNNQLTGEIPDSIGNTHQFNSFEFTVESTHRRNITSSMWFD